MNINGEDFFEDNNQRRSPVYRWASENAQVQRALYVRGQPLTHQILTDKALALLGCATMGSDALGVGGIARRWINRQNPASFPASVTPDNLDATEYLFCTSIPTGEPVDFSKELDGENRASLYQWYKYNTVWEALPYEVKSDDAIILTQDPLSPLSGNEGLGVPDQPDEGDALRRGWTFTRNITKQVDPGSQTETNPPGFMKYVKAVDHVGDPDSIPVGWPSTVPRSVIRYGWMNVPIDAIPWRAIDFALNNCVNDREFDGYPQASMLFTDPKIRIYRSAFGQLVADLLYTFICRPNRDPVTGLYLGWNALSRVKGGRRRYWKISCDGEAPTSDNDPPGRAAFYFYDMGSLFRPDQG